MEISVEYKQNRIIVDGTELFYKVAGDGKPEGRRGQVIGDRRRAGQRVVQRHLAAPDKAANVATLCKIGHFRN